MENNGSIPYPAPKPRLWTTQNIPTNGPFVHNPQNSLTNDPMDSFRPELQNELLSYFDAPFVTNVPPPGCQTIPNALSLNWNFPMSNVNSYSLGGWTEPLPFSYGQNGQAINITIQGLPVMPPTPEFPGQFLQSGFGYRTNPMSQVMDARNEVYDQNSGIPLTSSHFRQRSVRQEVKTPQHRPAVPQEFSHLPRKCHNPELPDLFQEKLNRKPHWYRPLPPREIMHQSESQVVWKSPPSNCHEPSQSSRGDYQGRQEPEFGPFRNEYEMTRERTYSNWNSPAYEFQNRQNEIAQNRNFDVGNSYGMNRPKRLRDYSKQPYDEDDEMDESCNWDNENEPNRAYPNSNWKYSGNDGSQWGRGFGSGYESYRQRYTERRSTVTSDLRNQVTPVPNSNQRNHEEVNAKIESHTHFTKTEPKHYPTSPNVVNRSIKGDEGQSSETPVNELRVTQMGPSVIMMAMTLQELRHWELDEERNMEKLTEVARLGPSRVKEELNGPDRNPIPDIVKVELESENESPGQEPTLGESKSPEELSDGNNTVKGLVGMELEKNQKEIAHIPISEVSQDKFPEEKTISLPVIVKVELGANEEEEVQVPLPERPQNLANLNGEEKKTVEDIVQGASQVEDSTLRTFQSQDSVNGSQQITCVDISKVVAEIKQQKQAHVQGSKKSRRLENLNRPKKSTIADKVKPERKQKEKTIDLDKQDGTKLSIPQENCTGSLKNTRLYSDIVKGFNTMDDQDKRPGNPTQEFLQKLGYETEIGKVNVDEILKEIEHLKTKKEHEKVHMLEEFLKQMVELPGGKELAEENESEWINVKNKKNKRKGIGNRSAWNASFN